MVEETSLEERSTRYDELLAHHKFMGIKDIVSDLNASIDQEPKVRLREDIFVRVFLPYFSGGDNIYKVGRGNWETVAAGGRPGGLYREVDVVDETDEVLFTVPPIYDRDAIKPTRIAGNVNLERLFSQAELIGHIKPSLTEQHKRTIFVNLLSNMQNSTKDTIIGFLTRWNDIFIRYGLEPILEEKNNTNHQSSDRQHSDDKDDHELEEL